MEAEPTIERSTPHLLVAVVTLLLSSAALQAQVLSLVEVHADNESPEGSGSPTEQTHLDGPTADLPGLVFSPDAGYVYVISNIDDAVTVFSRNSDTGALTLVEVHADNDSPEGNGSPTEQTHLGAAFGMAISPDGEHVYVTSGDDDAVTVLRRNSGTGALSLVEVHADDESPETDGSPIEQTHLNFTFGVAISPDGGHVYVTGAVDSAVTVFSRNRSTGALTLVEVHADNESLEAGGSPTEQTHLDFAEGVAVSPDGEHVYVTSQFDDAVTVFSRDSGTGALTLVEVHADDESPEGSGSPTEQTHLDLSVNAAISPDGGHVYVTSFNDSAVTVFSRNSGTGALALVEVHADDESPETDGSPTEQTDLQGTRLLAATGSHVLVTSLSDSAVTVFSRNSSTGALTLVEVHEDNIGQTHLRAASNVAISPGGSHVYVTSFSDDAVTVFSAVPTVPVELQSFSISDLGLPPTAASCLAARPLDSSRHLPRPPSRQVSHDSRPPASFWYGGTGPVSN